MFGSLGGAELILIFVVALLLFGPRRLPKIGRSLGKALSEFRRATNDFRSNLEREVHLSELQSTGGEIAKTVDEVKDLGVARGSILPAEESSGHATPSPPADATGSREP